MADSGKYVSLRLQPGINRSSTQHGAEPTWYDVDKIRFRNGYPENFYGWQRFIENPMVLDGVTREMHVWSDLNGRDHLAIGTHKKLYVTRSDTAYDITPFTSEEPTTVSTEIKSVAGSSEIRVSVSNELRVGDYVVVETVGATLGGNAYFSETTGPRSSWQITSVDTSAFTFNYDTSVSNTSNASEDHLLYFPIPTGSIDGTGDIGFGTSVWSGSFWGTPRESNPETQVFGTSWSLQNWGEDLLAQRTGSKLYHWHVSAAVSNRASVVSASPVADLMLVSDERFVIAFGTASQLGSEYSPMRIRWCASENFTDWEASIGNDAGDKLITGGSRIMSAVKTRGDILILTDRSAWTMRYQGQPFVYGVDQVGDLCGCISCHGSVDINGVAFWMSDHGFHIYDGVVRDIPCDIHRSIFDQREPTALNLRRAWKTYAGTNVKFDEVIWFYPSRDSNECDRYVIFNYVQNIWYYGTLARTAWVDRGTYTNPVAAGVIHTEASVSADTGGIFYHDVEEQGAGTEGFTSYLESGSFDLEDGDSMLFINRIIPDFDITQGEVNLYVRSRKYPSEEWQQKGPFVVSAGTSLINPRVRGRNFALRLECSTTTQWTMGAMRFTIRADGEQ